MNPVTIHTIDHRGDELILTGWPTPTPGLVVTEVHKGGVAVGTYAVTHESTGLAIFGEIESPEAALAAAGALAAVSFPWTLSASEIREQRTDADVAIINEATDTFGRFMGYTATPEMVRRIEAGAS